ncbi:unnamed protein product, partial [Gulo gulo]
MVFVRGRIPLGLPSATLSSRGLVLCSPGRQNGQRETASSSQDCQGPAQRGGTYSGPFQPELQAQCTPAVPARDIWANTVLHRVMSSGSDVSSSRYPSPSKHLSSFRNYP